ncbi:hypothetical protein RB614_08270 [Phytohabitans sp. ZYX-F-186]|uniref:Cell division protein FtsL n=1 Tax=Phytohabitans maris TaxID=3071409 RepID=A0ABU0ZDT5_9ACTN|nr:hypothetical protein [Phytohabitans sp. ZYX-F-186]MDQ7904517.1 hypothetical protein [Phytohabitans sp. ZYX-F-186]
MNASKRYTPRSGGRTAAREHQTVGNTALKTEVINTEPASAAPGGAPRERKVVPWLRVAPPLPVAVPRAPFIALILVVVVGGVLGILVVNTKINENAFRLSELRERQTSLDVQEQQLKQEIARAEDPGNLTAQAHRLGLVEGTPVQIRLPDGRVTGMMTPATQPPSITSQQDTGTGDPGTGQTGTGTGTGQTGTGTSGDNQQGTGTDQQPTE